MFTVLSNIVPETSFLTVDGHREAHSGQEVLVYHQGVCVKVLEVAVKVFRYSDDMWGGNLGLMYNLLVQIDQLYLSLIDGLPENLRTKVSSRCKYVFCKMYVKVVCKRCKMCWCM